MSPTGSAAPGRRPHTDPRSAALDAALAARTPLDAREARSLHRTRAALARLPRPFDVDADPTHVTASAIVVGARGVLLHRHKRLGRWLQPGGHVDAGEPPEDAAIRETVEETGISACHPAGGPVIAHVDAHDGGRGHLHLDVRYHVLAGDDDPAPPTGESQEVAWFGWEDAVALADPGLAAALRALGPR